jgi:hypothetical protein
MSKIKVSFEPQPSVEYRVPLFLTFGNSLYMLIKDNDSGEPYKLLSLENGHTQSGCTYSTMEEFLSKNKEAKFVDLDIKAKYI